MSAKVRSAALAGVLAAATLVTAAPSDAAGGLDARGSVNQVIVRDVTPGATLELRQDGGPPIATATADVNGTHIFGIEPGTADDVPRGSGYTVTEVGGDTVPVAAPAWPGGAPAEVLGPADHPPQAFYDAQVLPVPANATDLVSTDDDGYGYLTTRDGTTLSVNVLAPFNLLGSGGPYPTIVIYSGYTPSAPNIQGDPDDALGTLLRVAGYAVVSVNLRGTGCSGGAYSYWEPLQGLDGYDVIETVAAQPWVATAAPNPRFDVDGGPKVGMAGISYGGISQLFVARTNPPSLAGITPLSVIADTYRSTLYPGGILNDGFAQGWARQREDDARPAGQAWAAARIAGGDEACEQNQELKLNAPGLVERFEPDLLYQPDPGDSLAPRTFVDEIEVPTFIVGSFQDEQTGGHWATMLDDFDTPAEVAAGTDDLQRAVLFNGTHADALGPDGLRDLLEFLDLYVNRVAPQTKVVLRAEAPASLASVFGAPYALAPNRAAAVPDQRAYEAEDDVVVRWERGARDAVACRVDTNTTLFQLTETPCVPDGEGDGAPFGRYETTHATWPPSNATAQRWYLAPDGALTAAAPTVPDDAARGWSSFRYETDPGRTHTGTDPTAGGGIWDKDATYVWEPAPDSDELRFVGPPLATTRHYAGTGSATLFLRSTAPDVDLEVLLTEVRPDGQEILVQSGWLRASHRAEAPGSTALAPEHTHLAATPLPSGAFTRVRVELFPFAHTVRAGSRLALTVSAPGGNRPIWTFGSPEDDDATVNDIGHSLSRRSLLALPDVTTGFTSTPAVPTSLPVCGDLRSQPCRPTPESRRATAVTATFDRGTGTDRVRGVTLDWASPEAAGVTAYSVGELPTGTVTADDATPGLTLSVPAGSVPPPGDPVYTVTATFPGGDGPSSNASLGVVGPSGFRGVPAAAGYRDELDWASTWGAVTGTGPFRGSGATTRASEVRWLWNLHGRPTGFPAHGFTDAPAGGPLGLALRWARAEGIVNVLTGNRFAGGAVLTRATGVRWLWQAAGAPTGAPDHGFTDVGATAPYATALDWAVAEGVVAPAARFRPATALTRGTAVVWLERLAAAV